MTAQGSTELQPEHAAAVKICKSETSQPGSKGEGVIECDRKALSGKPYVRQPFIHNVVQLISLILK